MWMLMGAVTVAMGSFAAAGEQGGCGGACATCMASTQPAVEHNSAKYVCPMGCASSDKPGKCPKCGMDMVQQKGATTKPAAHQHQH